MMLLTPDLHAALRANAAAHHDALQFRTAEPDPVPLVKFFNPVGAARHIREKLKPDGTWLLVEPFAHDDLAENLNPVGRLFYGASTMICTPASMSQEVGLALGAQAGEKRLRKVVEDAGFTRFRRAAQTPFNLVFEVRP